MKNNEAAIFVFLASVIVGLLISMNLSFASKSKPLLSIEDYNDAYSKRNKLYNEVSNLSEEYNESLRKLQRYESRWQNDDEIIGKIQEEYKELNLELGKTAVEGEGITIMLNDASNVQFGEYYDMSKLVHDYDLLYILNDLRNAGAEAIAINGQRVVFDSASLCFGTNISLGGAKVVAPFYITAIGNKSLLENYLLISDSYYKRLKIYRGIETTIQQSNNIKVPAYSGEFSDGYIKIEK